MSRSEEDKMIDQEQAVSDEQARQELQFTDDQFIWRFSPNQTDPKYLEAIFVGRENLLATLQGKIEESATTAARHHVLLYGPRGIGKSHLISMLYHRIRYDDKLCGKIHIARLNEDETTTSMVQLLVRIYKALCKEYPEDYSQEWLDELLNQPPNDIAEILKRRLVKRFEKRTLIVFIENLSMLFENLGLEGQQDLRSFLQEHPFACWIATSQQLFKAVTDRSEPFYGFFQSIQLKPLSVDDAHQLLLNIAKAKGQSDLITFLNTPDGRGRVRAVHDLAGGNHRVYIVLSGFITRESLDQLVVPFQKMADDLTPYYQERLRWISAQQRQIVELLCRASGTLNPKEIARRLLASEQTTGSQVRKLVEIGYLSATKRGRETFYELSEPLMRLAYEVKENSLLGMLIDFLRIWYRPDQLQDLRTKGFCRSTQAYLDAAIRRGETEPDPRIKLLEQELREARAEGREHELASLYEEKAAATGSAVDWYMAGLFQVVINSDFHASLICCDEAIMVNPEANFAWNFKGNSLNNLGRNEEALVCYDKAIEIDPEKNTAWCNKGNSLNNLGRYEEALVCYDKAIEIDPEDANAWINKGGSLNVLGRYEEALVCLDKAIEIDPEDANAWINKGSSLNNLGRDEEALVCCDKAIEIDPEYESPRFNRSEALFAMQRWQAGFDAIRSAFAVGDPLPKYQGDVTSMFALIFSRSDNDEQLNERVHELVDIYQQAREKWKSGDGTNPLSYLGDGLVKSLARIDADRVTPLVLESYVQAVEQAAKGLPEFEVPLRLFRYGIRYLISQDPAEFVELITPERRILRQAVGLDEKQDES